MYSTRPSLLLDANQDEEGVCLPAQSNPIPPWRGPRILQSRNFWPRPPLINGEVAVCCRRFCRPNFICKPSPIQRGQPPCGRSRKLFARSLQLFAFTPVPFKGQGARPPHKPWNELLPVI